MNLNEFKKRKQNNEKISMVTCYDYTSAQILSESDVDILLVGDSLGMVMHGNRSTINVSTDLMALHAGPVVKGASEKFVVVDMPFLSHRQGISESMKHVMTLMQSGAQAIKIEGISGHRDFIEYCVESGVPVMGHLGLTPQSIHQLGGFKVQGRKKNEADLIFKQSLAAQEAGCFALVLECVPSALARRITQELSIPTIGIGAGPDTDGQVLVMQDLLGLSGNFKPKFLREFIQGKEIFKTAFNEFHKEVLAGTYPNIEESYE